MGTSVDLAAWPGAALRLMPDGQVASSNGRLEEMLGAPVVGRLLGELLDGGPSADKWRDALETTAAETTIELVLCVRGMPVAPRAFSLLRGVDELVLVEHPAHPRLAEMAIEVEETNSELVTAQRALVIERARLAAALRELERSNQALDEFAHAVSHDLKAPLRAIKDSGEVLSDPAVTSAERATHAARVVELVGRMRRMIDGVFEYARAGRASARADAIDTRRALAELVAYLNPPASIEVNIDPTLPTIVGARAPFDQVFRNLLSNAFTYRRGDAARVDVVGTRQGQFIEIAVNDNGPGITEAQLPRIWRLFQTSRPGEGTGIGLAVVRRLVEAEGGTIGVDSKAGVGSSFRVQWPMTPIHRGSRAAS